ncbi:flavodoxin domain-containing protein [Deltaproteobacteria bacterium]|nr:flavodoxin domain-containing protein [Deltaproteobacteria bacterium]
MNLIRSLLGRRQFLIAFVSSTMALAFGRFGKAFDLLFQTSVAKASDKPGSVESKPLKGIVIYYSATGSTAKIANAIYKGIKSVIPCDVAPVKKMDPKEMGKYDVVAIGAPNWYHREPVNVKMFTNNMPRMDGKHCILFNTHGTQPVSFFWAISKNMLKKGMTIIGWNDWYGDCTHYMSAGQPYITHGHPDEIDLMEAEAFGRQMAENSIRIYAGEKALIPVIPTPPGGVDFNEIGGQWSPRIRNNVDGQITHGGPPPNSHPEFDLTKCVYPRCTQCVDNCDVNAIDFSMITPAGSIDSPLILKEACSSCGGVCQRVCFYDVISYEAEKTIHVIDLTKCTYPKCTLCVDECLMDAIDFSKDPPVNFNRCEGCDVCWCVCPEDAITVPNNDLMHNRQAWWYRQSGMAQRMRERMGKENQGQQEDPEELRERRMRMPRFRQLIPDEEVGVRGRVMYSPDVPRIVLNKEDWPYEVDGG